MPNKDDLNITLDSILEMLSEVKAALKTKNNAFSKEEQDLLKQVLEICNKPQPDNNRNNLEQQEQLKAMISELKETIDKPAVVNNRYTIDVASSKNFMLIVGLIVAIVLSLFGNYYQFRANEWLADNDLKFRLIKMYNGVDSDELYKIERTFIYERNNKTISNIRKVVVEYEQKVIERAKELERARMKEEEAQKLLEEAEGLKNK
jgi:hypothetical protein